MLHVMLNGKLIRPVRKSLAANPTRKKLVGVLSDRFLLTRMKTHELISTMINAIKIPIISCLGLKYGVYGSSSPNSSSLAGWLWLNSVLFSLNEQLVLSVRIFSEFLSKAGDGLSCVAWTKICFSSAIRNCEKKTNNKSRWFTSYGEVNKLALYKINAKCTDLF